MTLNQTRQNAEDGKVVIASKIEDKVRCTQYTFLYVFCLGWYFFAHKHFCMEFFISLDLDGDTLLFEHAVYLAKCILKDFCTFLSTKTCRFHQILYSEVKI